MVAACIRLQLQIMEDESRGMTQICTVRSDERSQRNSCAHMLKTSEFSSQIPLPQTRREEHQHKWTICNIFECMTEGFFGKYLLVFDKQSVFLIYAHIILIEAPFNCLKLKLG